MNFIPLALSFIVLFSLNASAANEIDANNADTSDDVSQVMMNNPGTCIEIQTAGVVKGGLCVQNNHLFSTYAECSIKCRANGFE